MNARVFYGLENSGFETGISVVEIAFSKDQLLSANGRYHWAVKAGKTKQLRAIGRARGRQLGRIGFPCDLTVEIAPITKGRFDPDNLAPTVKALVDGLVDAGCLPDDSSEYIRYRRYVRIPRPPVGRVGNIAINSKEYLFRLIFVPSRASAGGESVED